MAARQRHSQSSTTAQENPLQSAIKNPIVKWILIIGGVLLVALLAIGVVKAISGEHVKIFGIEFNSPTPKTDTIFKNKPIVSVLEPQKDTPVKKVIPTVYYPVEKKVITNKDTTPKIQAKNVNTGTNSGIIGDVSINNEKQLKEGDKINLINLIDRIKADSSTSTMCVSLFSTTQSNGGKVSTQIADFLTSKGYKINETGIAFPSGSLNGVNVSYEKGCICIVVGVL